MEISSTKDSLENLLRNAWKFTSKHKSAIIEFGVKEHDGKTVYFVRDNGAGFDMAYVDKLFVPSSAYMSKMNSKELVSALQQCKESCIVMVHSMGRGRS